MGIKLADIHDAKLRRRIDQADAEQNVRHVVGGLEAASPERNKVPPLVGTVKARRQRKGRVVVRVVIIACRARLLDDDGAIFAAKPIRDAVCASLGIDDADARIQFRYGQVQTDGDQGMIVRISVL